MGSKVFTPLKNLFERGASEAAEGCLASVAAKLVKTATKILFTNIQTYIRVEINRAGKGADRLFPALFWRVVAAA